MEEVNGGRKRDVDVFYSEQKQKECFVQLCMRSCYDNPQHENIYEGEKKTLNNR